jgi:phage terminase large subunit-like protein
VEFINELHHTGDYWGQKFALRPWQEDIVQRIFDEKGKSRYHTVFIALGRKNGKTELAAAILNYLMFGTGKQSQNIYSASGDREQAALIYKAASGMIRQSQALSDISLCYDGYKRIECKPINGLYQALSSEHAQKYGLRPTTVIADELWVWPNRNLFNALTTAFGATVDPLTIMITTAGWDQTSLCYEQWKYAEGVCSGLIDDPGFLPIIFAADKADDWTDETTWKKGMPGLGDFCSIDFIRKECKRAQQLPAYENTFRQLYLNQWTEQAERWLSVKAWDDCALCLGGKDVQDYLGTPCYAGFDKGVTGDMSAFWIVWPTDGGVKVAGRCWVPKEGKWRDEIRNKDRYEHWHRIGLLHFTPGNAMDDGQIRKDIAAFNQHTPIISLFADRAYCTEMLNWLYNEAQIPVKGIPQGPITLNEACVYLEELVLGKGIEHGGNEILNWAVANCSLKRGTTGLVHPDKSSVTERIDALAALINALAALKADPENHGASVYESTGQLAL